MKISNKRRQIVFNKYNGKCAYCGCDITPCLFEPDHIIPRSRLKMLSSKQRLGLGVRAIDSVDNLNPSCVECNRQKWDRDIDGFRDYILENAYRSLIDNAKFRLAYRFGIISISLKDIVFHFERIGNE